LKNPEIDQREIVGFLLYYGERLKGARRNIEKSGGVAEGHDVGFLLYCGERPKGARSDIQNIVYIHIWMYNR